MISVSSDSAYCSIIISAYRGNTCYNCICLVHMTVVCRTVVESIYLSDGQGQSMLFLPHFKFQVD